MSIQSVVEAIYARLDVTQETPHEVTQEEYENLQDDLNASERLQLIIEALASRVADRLHVRRSVEADNDNAIMNGVGTVLTSTPVSMASAAAIHASSVQITELPPVFWNRYVVTDTDGVRRSKQIAYFTPNNWQEWTSQMQEKSIAFAERVAFGQAVRDALIEHDCDTLTELPVAARAPLIEQAEEIWRSGGVTV